MWLQIASYGARGTPRKEWRLMRSGALKKRKPRALPTRRSIPASVLEAVLCVLMNMRRKGGDGECSNGSGAKATDRSTTPASRTSNKRSAPAGKAGDGGE